MSAAAIELCRRQLRFFEAPLEGELRAVVHSSCVRPELGTTEADFAEWVRLRELGKDIPMLDLELRVVDEGGNGSPPGGSVPEEKPFASGFTILAMLALLTLALLPKSAGTRLDKELVW